MTRGFLLQAMLALVAIATVAFAIGWFAPLSRPSTARDRATSAAVFVHPGAVIGEAARRLGAADVATSPVAEEEVDTSIDVTETVKAPTPPPIDIATRLRGDLVAVVVEADRSVALLRTEGAPARRATAGDPYRDGWRFQDIMADAIVIARRGERRRVAVMGDYSGDQVAGLAETGDAPRRRLALSRQDARTRRP